jgi:hypothetical protein
LPVGAEYGAINQKEMDSMRKMVIAALAGALLATAVGVLSGAGAVGSSDDSTVTETVTETVEAPRQEDRGVREAGEDVSGPCDEAEHANDPRCTGAATPPTTGGGDDGVEAGEDVSGPCDEAEHANDPRCTGTPGTTPAPRVDNSGPGSMNSGPGSANSGRDDDDGDDDAGGDEDEDDDGEDEDHSGSGGGGNSGHGGGDNSGHGGGDDD